MLLSRTQAILCILQLAILLPSSYANELKSYPEQPSIPYVATRNDAVQDMLWMAGVGEDDIVYDLGSGDGRIIIAAVRDFGAKKAVGVEIDPELVQKSSENAIAAGVADRISIIEGDLFDTDFSEATVVALYLGHDPNIKLRSKLFSTLKPGTRVVSHEFSMGEWRPDKVQTVRKNYFGMCGSMWNPFNANRNLPEYTGDEEACGTKDKIFVWVVPEKYAGLWRGKINTSKGVDDFELVLFQSLSSISAIIKIGDNINHIKDHDIDIWDDHFRLICMNFKDNNENSLLRYDGHIQDNTINGTAVISKELGFYEQEVILKREDFSFEGTWEWPSPCSPRMVQLEIIYTNDSYSVILINDSIRLPVTDFYDSGNGFYFTLRLERNDDSAYYEPGGWIVGEAITVSDGIQGRLEYYPYRDMLEDLKIDDDGEEGFFHKYKKEVLKKKENTIISSEYEELPLSKHGIMIKDWRPKRVKQ